LSVGAWDRVESIGVPSSVHQLSLSRRRFYTLRPASKDKFAPRTDRSNRYPATADAHIPVRMVLPTDPAAKLPLLITIARLLGPVLLAALIVLFGHEDAGRVGLH
jgi:hypothetical protein